MDNEHYKQDHSMQPATFIKAAKVVNGQVVEGKHRSYIFQCDSEEDQVQWIECIRAHIFKSPILTLQKLKKFKMQQPYIHQIN